MAAILPNALEPIGAPEQNLTDRVYSAIRDAIIQRTLEPGTRVSEARLAQQLNVSKTPVREAILRLIHIGLVESTGRGARIPEPSPSRLRAAYELREGIEVQCARLAAQARTEPELEEILETAASCLADARGGDQKGFRSYDRVFHCQVGASTHNSLVRDHLVAAYDLTWALRLRDAPTEGFMVNCAEQHRDIAVAIKKHDSTAAERLMREHIHTVADKVLTTMAPVQAGNGHST